jgi:hypothetical protein
MPTVMTKEKTDANHKKHSDFIQEIVREALHEISVAEMPAKIKLRNAEQTFYIIIENMEAITIDHYYCTFYISKDIQFKCTHKLNSIKQILPCHFEYIASNKIINTQKVHAIGHAKPHVIIMHSGLELISSIEKAAEIEQLIEKNNRIIS